MSQNPNVYTSAIINVYPTSTSVRPCHDQSWPCFCGGQWDLWHRGGDPVHAARHELVPSSLESNLDRQVRMRRSGKESTTQ
jgi:hypothetical protein